MPRISSFRELEVHRAAFRSAMHIFRASKRWPAEERYELTSQVRRSSRSVCACIAEAWRKRRYPAAFVAKLNDAEAEASETRVWLDFALACGYLSRQDHSALDREYHSILARLVRMIDQADQWAIGRPGDERGRARRARGHDAGSRPPHPQSPGPGSETEEEAGSQPSATRRDSQSRRGPPRTKP